MGLLDVVSFHVLLPKYRLYEAFEPMIRINYKTVLHFQLLKTKESFFQLILYEIIATNYSNFSGLGGLWLVSLFKLIKLKH
jgi:hypothetical protein